MRTIVFAPRAQSAFKRVTFRRSGELANRSLKILDAVIGALDLRTTMSRRALELERVWNGIHDVLLNEAGYC
jgi:hypothetical protein